MATSRARVDEIVEAMSAAGLARSRSMMGEWLIYLDDKVIAMVCDDRLFLKPTDPGAGLLRSTQLASPYPGAKPHYVVAEADLADEDYLAELARATADALPAPKPRKPKQGS